MNKLILIIDDSPTVRKIIETCLGREDFMEAAITRGLFCNKGKKLPIFCPYFQKTLW